MTKSEFVRSQPLTMSGPAVTELARQAGLTIATEDVYKIRSAAKRRAEKASKPKKPAAPTKAKAAKKTAAPVKVTAPKKVANKPMKPAKAKTAGSRKPDGGDKSAFIRAQLSTMTPAQIVEQGKKAGFTFNAQYVYTVRARTEQGKKPAVAAKKTKMTKKPATPKPSPKAEKLNKAAFVRSMPLTMPVKDVVAAAKKQGMKLSDNYVYNVRTEIKKKSGPAKAKQVKQTPKPATKPNVAIKKPAVATGTMTPEMMLVRLALDIGLQRAKDLLVAVDGKIAGLIGSM